MTTKPFHYRTCGLSYVYLQNGFQYHETPYGKGVSIFAADKLHEVIARQIVVSPRPLGGQEVRFLRSLLDITQADLARLLGSTRVSITRWENKPDDPIPGPADAAMRLIYTSSKENDSLIKRVVDTLRERDDAEHSKSTLKKRFTLRTRGNGWDTARAA